MEKKTINEIISDWKTHSLPSKGYPSHSDRAQYLTQLFEEISRYGFSRTEASSQMVTGKILERLIAKTAKNDIKKSLNSSITEQIERAISIVYGSFASQAKEKVLVLRDEKEETFNISEKNEDINKDNPPVRPKKEKTVRHLSDDKKAELLKQFKFRTGFDEDLD